MLKWQFLDISNERENLFFKYCSDVINAPSVLGADEKENLGSVLLPSYRVSHCVKDDGISRKFSFKVTFPQFFFVYWICFVNNLFCGKSFNSDLLVILIIVQFSRLWCYREWLCEFVAQQEFSRNVILKIYITRNNMLIQFFTSRLNTKT